MSYTTALSSGKYADIQLWRKHRSRLYFSHDKYILYTPCPLYKVLNIRHFVPRVSIKEIIVNKIRHEKMLNVIVIQTFIKI